HIPVVQLFRPLVPVQLVGLAFVFTVAWRLGRRAEGSGRGQTVGQTGGQTPGLTPVDPGAERSGRRRTLVWVNGVITVAIMAVMIAGAIDPAVVFMIGTAIVLTINYPTPAEQRERIDAHARAALMMAGILLAAGAFTGIMKESGMLAAMAHAAADAV